MANQIRTKKLNRQKFATGARIHAQRIAFAEGDSSVKTIKYPVKSDQPEVDARVAEAVIADEMGIFGAVNLYACALAAAEGGSAYSVLDFWFDTLCAGGVFARNSAEMLKTALTLSGAETPIQVMLKQGSFADMLNLATAESFFNTRPRSGQTTENSLAVKIKGCFLEAPYSDEDILQVAGAIIEAGSVEEELRLKKELLGVTGVPLAANFQNKLGLTVCLLPGYEVPPGERSSREIVLLRRLYRLQAELDVPEKSIKSVYETMGINENALSNFLNSVGFLAMLREGKVGELMDGMMAMTPAWQGQEENLRLRLSQLADRVHSLYQDCPQFGKAFADYRQRLYSRLASWLSNFLAKLKLVQEQIPGVRSDLALFQRLLTSVPEVVPSAPFLDRLSALDDYLACAEQKMDADGALSLRNFQRQVPVVRSVGNTIVQKQASQDWLKTELEVKDEERIEFNIAFPKLSDRGEQEEKGQLRKLQAVPSFFGAAAQARFQKLSGAPAYFAVFMGNLEAVWRELLALPRRATRDPFGFFKNRVYQLWYLSGRCNTGVCREHLRDVLFPYGDIVTASDGKSQKFELKPQYSGKNGLQAADMVSHAVDVADALIGAGFAWKTLEPEERIDLIEVFKKAFALLVAVTDGAIDFGRYDWGGNPTVGNYLEVLGMSTLGGTQLAEFLQAAIFAELRGLSTLLSRQELTARFEIQTINGAQASLVCHPRAPKDPDRVTLPRDMERGFISLSAAEFAASMISGKVTPLEIREYPHQFGYQIHLPTRDLSSIFPPQETVVLSKPDWEDKYVMRPLGNDGPVMRVETSWHQVQYLNWHFQRAQNCPAEGLIKGTSLIAEKDFIIRWNLDTLSFQVEPKGAPRLYVAQPFEFQPAMEAGQKRIHNRFVGLMPWTDKIGYAVIEITGERTFRTVATGSFPGAGFSNRAESDYYKEKQRRGTYQFAGNRRVAASNDAANALRNRIHAVAIRFGAKPVWQWTPDVPKIGPNLALDQVFARAKRSDVAHSEEDKIQMKTVWGRSFIPKDKAARVAVEIFHAGRQLGSGAGTNGFELSQAAKSLAVLGHLYETLPEAQWKDEGVRIARLKRFKEVKS